MPTQPIIITAGDPAGCGPYVTTAAIKSLLEQRPFQKIDFTVVGDGKILNRLAAFRAILPKISLVDVGTPGIGKIDPGRPSKLTGRASLDYLQRALSLVGKEETPLVTAPVSKEAVALNLAGFCGHTEYLADYFGTKNFEMMMVSQGLKVVLMTRHVPLAQAGALLKKQDIARTITLTRSALRRLFRIKEPKIAVASFNPHAGVGTFFGKEEEELAAAVRLCKKGVFGPYPGDTLFTEDVLKRYDCVVCSYHDQGMIPLKLLAFKTAVNLTIGLPVIRTSPDHGPAFDLMRQGKRPFATSMEEAIKLAVRLSRKQEG